MAFPDLCAAPAVLVCLLLLWCVGGVAVALCGAAGNGSAVLALMTNRNNGLEFQRLTLLKNLSLGCLSQLPPVACCLALPACLLRPRGPRLALGLLCGVPLWCVCACLLVCACMCCCFCTLLLPACVCDGPLCASTKLVSWPVQCCGARSQKPHHKAAWAFRKRPWLVIAPGSRYPAAGCCVLRAGRWTWTVTHAVGCEV
jgi:hypothetical protein